MDRKARHILELTMRNFLRTHSQALVIGGMVLLAVLLHSCSTRYCNADGRRVMDRWTGKVTSY